MACDARSFQVVRFEGPHSELAIKHLRLLLSIHPSEPPMCPDIPCASGRHQGRRSRDLCSRRMACTLRARQRWISAQKLDLGCRPLVVVYAIVSSACSNLTLMANQNSTAFQKHSRMIAYNSCIRSLGEVILAPFKCAYHPTQEPDVPLLPCSVAGRRERKLEKYLVRHPHTRLEDRRSL
ncbi:hypothetical protein BKA70DRAFT_1267915 [Coprinopsis sp. MPI-PUGE-AT-0042]|nr:hypothetical protein BKA70DRAFT_1267915 [Coprinopsis sp. MPI-PUGE-AT-0042]